MAPLIAIACQKGFCESLTLPKNWRRRSNNTSSPTLSCGFAGERGSAGGKSLMAGPRVALITQVGILLSAFFFVTYPYRKTLADSMILSESEIRSNAQATAEELLTEGRRYQEAGQVETAVEKYKAALTLAQDTQDADKI